MFRRLEADTRETEKEDGAEQTRGAINDVLKSIGRPVVEQTGLYDRGTRASDACSKQHCMSSTARTSHLCEHELHYIGWVMKL
jgi:hypothetical protein